MRGIPWLSLGVLLLAGARVSGQSVEFRVDTDVFLGEEKEPFAENVTLFKAGLVYDFPLAGPREITVFDPSRGRFVLLDGERQVKTTLTTQELLEFVAAMKVHAEERGGLFAAAADPQFEQRFDNATGWVALQAPKIRYRARGQQPELELAAARYREFADWYARLNATRPGSLPPFARIELNRVMAERGWIPGEVELTLESQEQQRNRRVVLRSRHFPFWRLSATDHKRLEEAGTQLAQFRAVSFTEYRQGWQRAR